MKSFLSLVAVCVLSLPSYAGISVPSDGSDGLFYPTGNVEVDLSQAITGTWSDNNLANAGKGIYDPAKFAVVFKYTSVTVPTGARVTFKNHPSNAPVVWLVQGKVTINTNASVSLDGAQGQDTGSPLEPGPGGFRGGASKGNLPTFMAGLGPGGGYYTTNPSSTTQRNATHTSLRSDDSGVTYGNPHIIPLIGGSGGAGFFYPGYNYNFGGGGGGGALLIVAGETITINGTLSADGGISDYGSGSGGAIRMIADKITGTIGGKVSAGVNATVFNGRIRLEANEVTYQGLLKPDASYGIPGSTPLIWAGEDIPRVAIKSVNDTVAPAFPMGRLVFPYQDVNVYTNPVITALVETWNVPLTWTVYVRVVPRSGQDTMVNAMYVSGDGSHATWRAQFTAAFGFNVLQARAFKP